jgi:hypothetical protein
MKDLPFYERDSQLSGIAAAGSLDLAWNPSCFNNMSLSEFAQLFEMRLFDFDTFARAIA